MCEKCDLNEYAAELSTEKWLQSVQKVDEMATALAEARYTLAKDKQVMAEIIHIALNARDVAGYPVRGLVDQILARAGVDVDGREAKAG